jgi:hypothetical protein
MIDCFSETDEESSLQERNFQDIVQNYAHHAGFARKSLALGSAQSAQSRFQGSDPVKKFVNFDNLRLFGTISEI